MKTALDIHRTLLGDAVPHEIVRLPRAALSASDLPDVLGVDPAACIVVHAFTASPGDRLIAVALPADTLPDADDLSAALAPELGSLRLLPAPAVAVNLELGYVAGLLSPFCLPASVPFYAAAAVGAREVVYTAAGETRAAVGIRSRDLLVATRARVFGPTGPQLATAPVGTVPVGAPAALR